jgi:hypothetical protein
MAEEKKPKIDLKARLGKKTVTAPGGPTIPPPVGIPRPPGAGGVPVPPFGGSQRAAPKVDASDPYASISADAAPARAEPQAIKVEMSEEVVQAQRKGRVRVIVFAVFTALVGGALGYAFGGSVERNKGAENAVAGAHDLAKKVDKANGQLEKLADILKSANEKLADNKFPDKEVSDLGAVNVPFEGADLVGTGMGRFKPELVNLLITFAGGAHDVNDQKDTIRDLLSGEKSAIDDFLSQRTKPKVRWAVYLKTGAYGPWAEMQPLPTPFLVTSDQKGKPYSWPKTFELTDSGKKYKLDRYTGGDPKVEATNPKIIPVDPTSEGSVCPSDVLLKLRQELGKVETTLKGDKTPGHEKDGLIDTGKALLEKLKAIGAPS